jgi:GH18 family chitinase
MKSKLLPLLTAFLLLFSTFAISQASSKKNKDFKIIGYYLLGSILRDTLANTSDYTFLDKVTHINIAFINPDSSGNLPQNLPIASFVNKAHSKGVKVLASIAGGGPHPYYAILLKDDKRKVFIDNLVALVSRYNLDGVDVDLEGNDIDTNYESFVTELGNALKQSGKLMTAAIATPYKDRLSDNALKQFDFVNVMSYDRTGPWRPKDPGPHSPYEMAEQDLQYWHETRRIPKKKLVLGVPFYGYGFGAPDSSVSSMTYKDIVAGYPNAASTDTFLLPDNSTMYYNGTATIARKTALALKEASGIMIWQLSGDASGEKSLLTLISNIAYRKE